MAGVLVSPSLDSQIRKRSSLYKKRNESPNFRDLLRARCHARIKASRCALIDKFRDLSDKEELHDTLSGILREELNVLKNVPPNSKFFDNIEELEEYSEEDQWLLDEYEKILAEEEANFNEDWENQVICPLCEMSVLTHDGRAPICMKCKLYLPPVESLSALKNNLDAVLMIHSENCDQRPTFALMDNQELSGLFLICESCFSFSQVIQS